MWWKDGTLKLMSSKSGKRDWNTDRCVKRHQDKQFPNNYLNSRDMMPILSCGRNTGHQLCVLIGCVKLGSIVIDIVDVHSDYHFPFARTARSFSFNVECVEEEWHLLGRLGGRRLKYHGYHDCIILYNKQTIQIKNFDDEPMLNILIIWWGNSLYKRWDKDEEGHNDNG